MPINYGEYDGEVSLDDGVLVDDLDDGTWLISSAGIDRGEVELSEIDNEPGRVRFHTVSFEDDIEYNEMEFETFRMARLAYGLWDRCGPFDQPEGSAVPVEIATDGQEAIAAYLRLGNGFPKPRRYVAGKMDVTEQTVSNYCNRVRWMPE